ncbi:MAG: AraC family transcriptional regulator [Leucobacter sp.]|nr:AraC family transcriptional regulator [Leucobacter sp.]
MTSTPLAFGDALDRLPTEESRNPDESVEIVSQKFTPHALVPKDEHFHFTARTGQVGSAGIHHIGYGTPVEISSTPLENRFLVCLPAWGKAVLEVDGEQWFCDSRTPMILPNDREFRMHWLDGSPQLVLAVRQDSIEQVASSLFGEAETPIHLPRTLSVASGAGSSFAAHLLLAHDDVNSGIARDLPELLTRNITEGLLTRLLLAAAEQQEALGEQPAEGMLPKTKIVDACMRILNSPEIAGATPLSIAQQLQIPLRTLQDNVQAELGISLGDALRRSRLRLARAMLLDADPAHTTVTDVAYRCGFRHLGRFSVEYHKHFSEKPSETLRMLA